MKKKRIIAVLIMVIMVALLVGAVTATTASAKTPRNGKVMDSQGNIYIYKHGKLQTGWFKYHGKTYYGHKTKSACYPKGSVARNTYRVRHGRMYYMKNSGAKQTKDSKYITLNRHRTSVHYIYAPGLQNRGYRYNANRKRFQYLDGKGKWKDTGMQCYPVGMIDFQE